MIGLSKSDDYFHQYMKKRFEVVKKAVDVFGSEEGFFTWLTRNKLTIDTVNQLIDAETEWNKQMRDNKIDDIIK